MTFQLLAPELKPEDRIQFAETHRVSLSAGDYSIKVTQHIKTKESETNEGETNESETNESETTFASSHEFSIRAERFAFDPQIIHAEYPPAGSRGDFQADLPHVILNRSTLPWERTAKPGTHDPQSDPPWLALLLFNQAEAQELTASTVKLSDYTSHLETGQDGNDQIRVIDVKWSVLEGILPVDLSHHAHARRRLAFLTSLADKPGYTKDAAGAKAVLADANGASADMSPEEIEPGKRWRLRNLAERAEYEVCRDDAATWSVYRLDAETAVILGNRLPTPGQRNVVHLVSLEGRYPVGSFDREGRDPVRLVSLYAWEFNCENPAHTFSGLLTGLNRAAVDVVDGSVRLSLEEAKTANISNGAVDVVAKTLKVSDGEVARITSGDWTNARRLSPGVVAKEYVLYDVLGADSKPLRDLNGTLQVNGLEASAEFGLPSSAANRNDAAAALLSAGLVPLRHYFRDGNRSVSWYHGPLVAATPDVGKLVLPLPATSADQLMIYDPSKGMGMFDVSYAAAWELGRMLTLQNRKVALSLSHWKRSRKHGDAAARTLLGESSVNAAISSLFVALNVALTPFGLAAFATGLALPEEVQIWLSEMGQLVHLPFQYLVPDERLLPPESIRFFHLDPLWLRCLFDGACSVGGNLPDATVFPTIAGRTGVLLRSEVVAGWPGLRADGYGKVVAPEQKLQLLRMERLSQEVLLCLFDGDLTTLDVHLRPETLHFGIGKKVGGGFVKTLRDSNGIEKPDWTVTVKPDPATNVVSLGPLDGGLPKLIQAKLTELDQTSVPKPGFDDNGSGATFALQMVAGVELVRFTRPT